MYPALAFLFFFTVGLTLFLAGALLIRPVFVKAFSLKTKVFLISFYSLYAVFIIFFTGPRNLNDYPDSKTSPYKLPWQSGVSRFVAQGNRSFTSHRGLHEGAWDFVMPNGTPVLAARDGIVEAVDVGHDGIGLMSNYINIRHADGDISGYAHLMKAGALVKVGDAVKQGQPIGYSGMVGQTVFPHVHFLVMTKDGTEPQKISFSDVPDGVPQAGHFYTSGNDEPK